MHRAHAGQRQSQAGHGDYGNKSTFSSFLETLAGPRVHSASIANLAQRLDQIAEL